MSDVSLNELGDRRYGFLSGYVEEAMRVNGDAFAWQAEDREDMGGRILRRLSNIERGRIPEAADEHSKDVLKQSLFKHVMRTEMILNGCNDFDEYMAKPDKSCLVDPGTCLILGSSGCESYKESLNERYADMYDPRYADCNGYDNISLTKLVMDAKASGYDAESWHGSEGKCERADTMARRMVNLHMDPVEDAAKAQVLYNAHIGEGSMFGGAAKIWLESEGLSDEICRIRDKAKELATGKDTQAFLAAKSDPVLSAAMSMEVASGNIPVVSQGNRTIKNVPEFMQNDGSEMQYE